MNVHVISITNEIWVFKSACGLVACGKFSEDMSLERTDPNSESINRESFGNASNE